MAYNFKECNGEQVYLLPPALQECPPTDLVWLVIDAVEEMDLKAFYLKYCEDGKGQAISPSGDESCIRNAARRSSRYSARSKTVGGSDNLCVGGLKPVPRNGNSSARRTIS